MRQVWGMQGQPVGAIAIAVKAAVPPDSFVPGNGNRRCQRNYNRAQHKINPLFRRLWLAPFFPHLAAPGKARRA